MGWWKAATTVRESFQAKIFSLFILVIVVLSSSFTTAYFFQEWNSQTEKLLTEALEIDRRVFGEIHPTVATVLNNLGVLAFDQGELDQARCFAQQARAIREKTLPRGHPDIAKAKAYAAKVNKPLINTEIGCIARSAASETSAAITRMMTR